MQEHYLESGHGKIYYRKNEFKRRHTLVFVHGLSGSSSAWVEYEKYFERDFNVLSFDLRGHGNSFRPKKYSDYSMLKFSEDINLLFVHEKLFDVTIISHSMGSLVVLEFLRSHQDKVRNVILVSPAHDPSNKLMAKLAKPVFYLGHVFPVRHKSGHVKYDRFIGTGDWNVRRMYNDISNTGLASFLHATRQAYSFRGSDVLPAIEVPTLIVHGRRDSIFSLGQAKYINLKIKNSELKIIDNADHIVVLNNFKELSQFIDEFLKKENLFFPIKYESSANTTKTARKTQISHRHR